VKFSDIQEDQLAYLSRMSSFSIQVAWNNTASDYASLVASFAYGDKGPVSVQSTPVAPGPGGHTATLSESRIEGDFLQPFVQAGFVRVVAYNGYPLVAPNGMPFQLHATFHFVAR
jgi:hypothetical protein